MSLPPQFLDEIRARVPLSRIIGKKVVWDLRRSNQAKGDWWAPCPFHGEKTASFHVDDQKGFYYCFGCHAKGDALTFLREAEGMGFIEAVELLAAEAGLPMPERDPRQVQRSDRRNELVEVMELAQRWFRMQLGMAPAEDARAYLQRRGLDAAACEQFGIGFAPDQRQGLFNALRSKGVAEALIVDAGLAARPDGGGAPFDRFRGRIIFPIRDGRGRCIAFGGRSLDPNARAKYLNSPETALFDKGRNLYNIGPARAAVAKGRPLVVAEGYMDVIALVRAGFDGAVAPLGTAITEEQLRLMWRVSPEPVIALDGDSAGLRAAMRLIDLALPLTGPGQALRFAFLPQGMDPDDLIRAKGSGAMQAVLDQARPLVDLLWRRETEGKVFDSPERRAALDRALAEAVARIPDKDTRDHYFATLRQLKWELFGASRRGASGARGAGTPRTSWPRDLRHAPLAAPAAPTRASRLSSPDADETDAELLIEAMVLAICATHPSLIANVESRLERLAPQDADRAALVHDLLSGGQSQAGQRALESIMAEPHVKTAPAILRPQDGDAAAEILTNALDRIEARRAAREEIARAEAEIQGLADEGLTWRMAQSAKARQRADHPSLADLSDLGEDSEAHRAILEAALRNEIWRKPRR
ncbi:MULTISPECIES: DNA primase [unclassified Paracoccus (in: a-proteobacteria)]|uniref:DNA primase n=1 Tax=unclassified Paracoccus (in: a-proteobacteria) TaxID=2688777 RepID=UPI0012B1C33D|nr:MULTISPECIES: DNA primase [unclassified Paracoccus (in: a-proteobacteria)]UXU74612.1 DNA primase [Paracoccus sp. SMMA_5]UXU80506.1 DNA primase [Paracoccus sp. SMMA_5_TC]